jgi:uncharacterized protein (TIGR00369 family)
MRKLDADAVWAFFEQAFPAPATRGFALDRLDDEGLWMSWTTGPEHLRPGGTLSGPTLFALADVAAYLWVAAHYGPAALAVTSQCHLHFLRKPSPGLLQAHATTLKLGRRLADVRVDLKVEGALVATGTLTYAIPDGFSLAPLPT